MILRRDTIFTLAKWREPQLTAPSPVDIRYGSCMTGKVSLIFQWLLARSWSPHAVLQKPDAGAAGGLGTYYQKAWAEKVEYRISLCKDLSVAEKQKKLNLGRFRSPLLFCLSPHTGLATLHCLCLFSLLLSRVGEMCSWPKIKIQVVVAKQRS